jgi:hypothetical protein
VILKSRKVMSDDKNCVLEAMCTTQVPLSRPRPLAAGSVAGRLMTCSWVHPQALCLSSWRAALSNDWPVYKGTRAHPPLPCAGQFWGSIPASELLHSQLRPLLKLHFSCPSLLLSHPTGVASKAVPHYTFHGHLLSEPVSRDSLLQQPMSQCITCNSLHCL